MRALGLSLVLLTFASAFGARASRPHLIVLFADNLGWANVGYHRPEGVDLREYATPHIDALAAEGMQLDRHYTYKYCSPSRSSLLSGRLPVHVNIYNDDPAMPGQGVPVNMTLLPEQLGKAGYVSHFVGKWHVGMASRRSNPPEARGFSTSLGYFHSTNNYYNGLRAQGCADRPARDVWDTGAPAPPLDDYEERVFARRAVARVLQHDVAVPLFLYYAFHSSCVGYDAHGPGGDALQPDAQFYAAAAFIDHPDRRANHAMVALMDAAVGNVTAALRLKGMWASTLLLWSSDNGGAVHPGGGANTYPLRGGYFNNWEGGIRVAALLAGGALPAAVRGTKLEGFIHEADWYATFCHLAGVPPHDARAAAAEPPLPPIDSLSVWQLISGANATSPRVEWPLTPLGEMTAQGRNGSGTGSWAGGGAPQPWGGDAGYMAEGRYKLLVGEVRQAGWPGPLHPNASSAWDSYNDVLDCRTGCLFDVLADPSERHDLAATMPAKRDELLRKLRDAEPSWFNPDRGEPDLRACEIAKATGHWQPFME